MLDGKETGAFKPGLKVGLVAEYSLVDRITLQSGVSLTTKGFKHVMYNHKGFRTPESSFEWSTNISYLELPLNIW